MISFVCLSELSGANAMRFLERLELLPQDQCIRLAQFISKQCLKQDTPAMAQDLAPKSNLSTIGAPDLIMES
jgi:hypothetical protein